LKFPYTEAREYGISTKSFRRAILQLWEHGFLTITEVGGQTREKRICSTYDLIDNWRLFSQPGFNPRPIPKGICFSSGFQEYNRRRKEETESKKLLATTDYKPIVTTDYKPTETDTGKGVGADYKNE
jgi:hypothetical protein